MFKNKQRLITLPLESSVCACLCFRKMCVMYYYGVWKFVRALLLLLLLLNRVSRVRLCATP